MSKRPSAAPSHEHTLSVTLTTTLALIDQFSISISNSSNQLSSPAGNPSPDSIHSPLPLLSAAAASLKAQSTKLSLLTLTPPFTPSAVSTVLSTLNSSVLPSLLTAALLIANEEHKYTASFSAEVRLFVKSTLCNLQSLISRVERRSKDGNSKSILDDQQKSGVMEAVGRVWEACDELVALADGGVGAFVVKKAEMWLGLIKDAVEEIGEWDPEIDGVDGLFGEDAQQDENADEEAEEGVGVIEKAKASAMKVLNRVPQSLHVVVKQRLRKMDWVPEGSKGVAGGKTSDTAGRSLTDHKANSSMAQGATVDDVLRGMRHVSETVDEMAEALYMGQLGRSGRLVKDIWQATVEVVEIVTSLVEGHAERGNWRTTGEDRKETAEEKYIRRALEWIRVVEPKSPSSKVDTNDSVQETNHG